MMLPKRSPPLITSSRKKNTIFFVGGSVDATSVQLVFFYALRYIRCVLIYFEIFVSKTYLDISWLKYDKCMIDLIDREKMDIFSVIDQIVMIAYLDIIEYFYRLVNNTTLYKLGHQNEAKRF